MADTRRLTINLVAGVLNSFGKVGIQLVMLPVMARLLGPEELSLSVLALPILNFVLLMSDAGLGNSLARESKQSGTLVWSSAFWGLIGLSTLLAIAAYAASFFVADAAQQPRLPNFMIPLCVAIVLFGAAVIPNALITRDGKNYLGSVFDLSSNVVAAGVAVYLALQGAGVWAMAAQSLVLYASRFVLYNAAYPFIPRFEFSLASLKSHMGMGGAQVGVRFVDAAGKLWENAAVSRQLGAGALGAYGYANQIGRFFTESVASPIWANLYYLSLGKPEQSSPDAYMKSQRMLAMSIIPASALLAPLLPLVIPTLFGPKWTESILPMMILVVTYPLTGLGNQIFAVLTARGQTKFFALSAPLISGARLLAVLLFYSQGIFAISIGLAVVNFLHYVGGTAVAMRTFGNKLGDYLTVVQGPINAAIVAGTALLLLLGPNPDWLKAAMMTALCGVLYCVVLMLIDRRHTMDDIRMVTKILKGKMA